MSGPVLPGDQQRDRPLDSWAGAYGRRAPYVLSSFRVRAEEDANWHGPLARLDDGNAQRPIPQARYHRAHRVYRKACDGGHAVTWGARGAQVTPGELREGKARSRHRKGLPARHHRVSGLPMLYAIRSSRQKGKTR